MNDEGKLLTRAFAQFIMDPICMLSRACMEGNKDKYLKMLVSLEIKLT